MGGVLAKIVFKNKLENIPVVTQSIWDIKQKDIDGNTIVIGDLLTDTT